MKAEVVVQELLDGQLRELHLPTIRSKLRGDGAAGGAGDAELRAFICSGCASGSVRSAAAAIERLVRQSRLPLEKTFETFDLNAPADEGGSAGAEPARGGLRGAEGEPVGLWEAGFWEDAFVVCARARFGGSRAGGCTSRRATSWCRNCSWRSGT